MQLRLWLRHRLKNHHGGSLTTLYSFCSQTGCVDGAVPIAALVQAHDCYLYGTTTAGGSNMMCPAPYHDIYGSGCGTVFRLTANAALDFLYSFCSRSACADGQVPAGSLVQASNGDLYGTTEYGGYDADNYCSSGFNGCGTIFRITPGGALATVHTFCEAGGSCTDGAYPTAALIQATDGYVYGTASAGGQGNGGTIFKITQGGFLITLHDFCLQPECTDGTDPFSGLIQNTNGDFYGTTYLGGDFILTPGPGTVFSLSVGLNPFVEPQTKSGKAGMSVRTLGTDLTGATNVSFNGTSAAFEVVSGSEIVTRIPAGATSGKILVVTPTGTLSSNVVFRVFP